MTDTTTPPERIWIDRPDGKTYIHGATHAFQGGTPYVREDLTGWRDIESAPKDGTRILVSCVYDVQGEAYSWEWVDWWGGDEGQEHWLDFPKQIPAPFPPTHWMPLPTPPEARP